MVDRDRHQAPAFPGEINPAIPDMGRDQALAADQGGYAGGRHSLASAGQLVDRVIPGGKGVHQGLAQIGLAVIQAVLEFL